MSVHRKALQLLVVALVLGACATTSKIGRPPEPAAGVYGIDHGKLVAVNGSSDTAGAEALGNIGAMTYDPEARRFYAIASEPNQPGLIAVDPSTGEATAIGPIETTGVNLTLVEGLAFDPLSSTLYAAGGASTFASNILLTVDVATGKAQQVARIRGTIQDEVDAMTFVDGVLYAFDGAGNSSALYRLDLDTGQATRISKPFAGTVADMAFDPAGRRLLGVQGSDGRLLSISLDGEGIQELPTSAESLTALAIIPDSSGGSLFNDSFESGDASAWSASSESKQ